VPLSLDLTASAQALSYRYRLVKRPQQVVESNPAICAGEPVFRGTRIPVAVVVEQLRAGTQRDHRPPKSSWNLSPCTICSPQNG
jgi:hypothetical protein